MRKMGKRFATVRSLFLHLCRERRLEIDVVVVGMIGKTCRSRSIDDEMIERRSEDCWRISFPPRRMTLKALEGSTIGELMGVNGSKGKQ